MTSDQYQALQKKIATLDNDALVKMIAIDRADYREEAIEIAREELRRRGIRELTTEEYLSLPEIRTIRTTGFCSRCLAETTDESPGNVTTVNLFFGTRLIGIGDPCTTCGSIVQGKYFCLLLPIVFLGRYRIKYLKGEGTLHSEYVGRRLRAYAAPNKPMEADAKDRRGLSASR
jgi:hypothetical protein